MVNRIHKANKVRWEAGAARWGECAESRGIWKRCSKKPSLVFSKEELKSFAKISGKKVCVLGSGDNEAVFAFAGLGAKVTSVDISENQLQIAQQRAKQLGLSISFVQADVTDLKKLPRASFDFVYTGGHVAVWVSNLNKYYAEAIRILKKDGLFIVKEYHPFRRVWKESKNNLELGYNYFKRGPFKFEGLSSDVLYEGNGSFTSFEFHWTVSDYINAILKNKCTLLSAHEMGDKAAEWEGAPMNGLPEFLMLIAKKQTK